MKIKKYKNTLTLLAITLTIGVVYLFVPRGTTAPQDPIFPAAITDPDTYLQADVLLQDAVKRLQTSALVTVDQLFGREVQSSTYLYFGDTLEDANGIGSAGDSVNIAIPAAVSPLNAIYPAVTKG